MSEQSGKNIYYDQYHPGPRPDLQPLETAQQETYYTTEDLLRSRNAATLLQETGGGGGRVQALSHIFFFFLDKEKENVALSGF